MRLPEPTFACLGIDTLGQCFYNPASPNLTMFTIGDAIAALGFTLAIQQFLKPIYLFRLRTYGLKFGYLFSAIFFGFSCSLIAAFLPNIPSQNKSFFEYPIVWEIIGAFVIGGTYALTAFITLGRARIIGTLNISRFIRAGAHLLSSASEEDRISFADDLLHSSKNIEKIIAASQEWERAENAAVRIKFEELKKQGLPQSVQGRQPISPFYKFARRKELNLASLTSSFLNILSDQDLCKTLVSKRPWLTAWMLRDLASHEVHSNSANSFIQEIAKQSIECDESMISKEAGFDGFGTVRFLSESLFSNLFILRFYDPMQKVSFSFGKNLSAAYISRLNVASKIMLEVAIEERDYWQPQYLFAVERAYENLFHSCGFEEKGISSDVSVAITNGVRDLYNATMKASPHNEKSLFVVDTKKHRNDLIHIVASIVYESLLWFSNTFKGHDDENWHHAISVFMDIYPFHDDEPEGLNPLQQQLAVMLVDKLQDNMRGYYPSISRVLLAVIGPYDDKINEKKGTAFVLLKQAAYKQLQAFPELYKKDPDKIKDYLPDNVTYDTEKNVLTHTYRSGEPQVTKLSEISIPDIDLTNKSNWNLTKRKS